MSVLTVQIEESAGDGHENESGTCNITATSTLLNGATGGANVLRWGGRFKNITFPRGTIITGAYLYLWGRNETEVAMKSVLGVANEDSAAEIKAEKENLVRQKTKEFIVWESTFIKGGFNKSMSFHHAVQQVLNRAGWVSGNNILVIAEAYTSACLVSVEDWDGTHARAAKLELVYEGGTGFFKNAPPTFAAPMHRFEKAPVGREETPDSLALLI